MGAQHNEWYAARSMVALADGGDVVEMDDVLMARARSIRDRHYGHRITYSPKVFIPVTQLCRDVCHYCTFAKTPSQLSALYLEMDEIIATAREGARAGCREVLLTLGEKPEFRYRAAREWLQAAGFDSTVGYVATDHRTVDSPRLGSLPSNRSRSSGSSTSLATPLARTTRHWVSAALAAC